VKGSALGKAPVVTLDRTLDVGLRVSFSPSTCVGGVAAGARWCCTPRTVVGGMPALDEVPPVGVDPVSGVVPVTGVVPTVGAVPLCGVVPVLGVVGAAVVVQLVWAGLLRPTP
jgi:hypothetical protein